MNTLDDLVDAVFNQSDADFYHNRDFNDLLNIPTKEEFEEVVAATVFKRLVKKLNELPHFDETKADIDKREKRVVDRVATNVVTLADKMGSISMLQFGRSLELVSCGYSTDKAKPKPVRIKSK